MCEATFAQLESLTPSGRADVPVRKLRELLVAIPDPSEETLIAIKVLDQFETAQTFQEPTDEGVHLWLGYCVGGFHEWPRREAFFLFAARRQDGVLTGHATGIVDDDAAVPELWTPDDLERVSSSYVQELHAMLAVEPSDGKRSDWFSPIAHTDGNSVAFKPNSSARYFLRQISQKLLFVQPSRCGGWYGELWKKEV